MSKIGLTVYAKQLTYLKKGVSILRIKDPGNFFKIVIKLKIKGHPEQHFHSY